MRRVRVSVDGELVRRSEGCLELELELFCEKLELLETECESDTVEEGRMVAVEIMDGLPSWAGVSGVPSPTGVDDILSYEGSDEGRAGKLAFGVACGEMGVISSRSSMES